MFVNINFLGCEPLIARHLTRDYRGMDAITIEHLIPILTFLDSLKNTS